MLDVILLIADRFMPYTDFYYKNSLNLSVFVILSGVLVIGSLGQVETVDQHSPWT